MVTVDAFGHCMVLSHCDHREYYINHDIASAVDKIFALPEVQNRERGADWDSHYGKGETSEVNPYLGPAHIPGASNLIQWIKSSCVCALSAYNITANDVKITRSWMNRMNQGSQGRCHVHTGKDILGLTESPDLVAIFYVNNPENGSKLVIVKDGVAGTLPSDIPESNKIYITPNSGDLVIHRPEVYHAVSEHCNSDPRICFVFQLTAIKP
jgi:hypothetical protein